jgi:hypothetical protein
VATFELDQADLFPPGTKVGLYPRHTDHFAAKGLNPLKTFTVGSDGIAKLTGLDEDVPYFVAAEVEPPDPPKRKEWHTASITALSDASRVHPDLRTTPEETIRRRIAETQAASKARAEAERRDPLAASPAPGKTVEPNRVKNPPKLPPEEKPPSLRQEHVQGIKQSSDTRTGEATPLEPVKKAEPKGSGRARPRRSTRPSNRTKKATVPKGERPRPGLKQAHVQGRKQSSDTAQGEATPVAVKKAARKRAKK